MCSCERVHVCICVFVYVSEGCGCGRGCDNMAQTCLVLLSSLSPHMLHGRKVRLPLLTPVGHVCGDGLAS